MKFDSMTEHDLDELIPGNNIDRIYGSDRDEWDWQNDELQDCADHLGAVVVR